MGTCSAGLNATCSDFALLIYTQKRTNCTNHRFKLLESVIDMQDCWHAAEADIDMTCNQLMQVLLMAEVAHCSWQSCVTTRLEALRSSRPDGFKFGHDRI